MLEAAASDAPLIAIDGLVTEFNTEEGPVRAVNGVSFSIGRGKTLVVLGESGCGKSVTGFSIINLVRPPGRVAGGTITYYGASGSAPVEITKLKPTSEAMRRLRGAEISMVFQEPMTSFDPLFTIGDQLVETLRAHDRTLTPATARQKAVEMLEKVRMPRPDVLIDRYPHQLSGGMRQRVMLGMALCCEPTLLIADEPTTALDVTTESQILDLLRQLQAEMGMAVMFITHNLAVASEMADDIVVMYLGRIVEQGPAERIFEDPRHPYTLALLDSIPKLGETAPERLKAISGMVPTPDQTPAGCPFHPRCRHATRGICDTAVPPLFDVGGGHSSRCFLEDPEKARQMQ